MRHAAAKIAVVIVGVICVGSGRPAAAQQRPATAQQAAPDTVTIAEETPGLMKRAKVGGEAARTSALARVRNGHITKAELEEEDGKLIYSFDIAVGGKRGIEEVHVDAMTGRIISVEHEADAAAGPKAAGATPGTKPPPAR